jgi:hypothetical protein
MVNWFSILLVICSFFIVVQMLRIFPSKETPKYVYVFVFAGWLLPFVSVAIVPYDVYLALSGDGDTYTLYVAWDILYWVVFGSCWVVLPLMKNVMTSGEFTFLRKLLHALIIRAKYLLFLSALGIAFIIFLAVSTKLGETGIPAFLTAMGNAWGLFMIIILMGYGVVAIPKLWWYKGDYQRSLNYLRLKAVQLDETIIDTKYELDQVILKAIAYEKELRLDEKLQGFAQRIINRCPREELEFNRNRNYNLPETDEPSLKNLIALNTALKGLKSERVRLDW